MDLLERPVLAASGTNSRDVNRRRSTLARARNPKVGRKNNRAGRRRGTCGRTPLDSRTPRAYRVARDAFISRNRYRMFLFRRLGVARNFLFLFHRTEVPCHRLCVTVPDKKKLADRGSGRDVVLTTSALFSPSSRLFPTVHRRPRDVPWNSSPFAVLRDLRSR